jgi:hypothetical protein
MQSITRGWRRMFFPLTVSFPVMSGFRKRCAVRSGLPHEATERFRAIRHPILIETAHRQHDEPRSEEQLRSEQI